MATTVYVSADPAVVRNYAVLFMAVLPVDERVRISYNHVNGMAEPLTLSLVVLNDADEAAPLDFLGGYAGPDADSAAVGHTATASFFREKFSGTARSELLAAHARVALIARGFAPQECLCGIFEIKNRSARAMRVAVVACGVGIAPSDGVGMFASPPLGQSAAPDDERPIEHDLSGAFSLPESASIPGVLSTFDVALANDTGRDVPVDIVIDTKGFSSATLAIDKDVFEVARTPPHTPAIVETLVVPAAGRAVSIVIATDLNAAGPGIVSFAPHAVRTARAAVAPLPAAAVTMDSSGSSARGVAAEVGARPAAAATSRIAEPLASAVIAEAPSLAPGARALTCRRPVAPLESRRRRCVERRQRCHAPVLLRIDDRAANRRAARRGRRTRAPLAHASAHRASLARPRHHALDRRFDSHRQGGCRARVVRGAW